MVKNLPANAGDVRDGGSIPGSGRAPGRGHGSALQYSCLENPMDRRAWWATVHGVTKSWTLLSDFTFHFVKDKVSIGAWIYLWAFYFVPLIYILSLGQYHIVLITITL